MRVSNSSLPHLRLALSAAMTAVVALAPMTTWAQQPADRAPAATPAAQAAPATAPATSPAPATDRAPAQEPRQEPAPATPTTPIPGKLILQADADDLVAEVRAPGSEPRMVGLKKGDNSVDVASGAVQVSIQTKGGRKVSDATVDVPAGGEGKLAIRSRGTVIIQVPADADVSLDGKEVEGQEGKFTAELEPGAHSLVVQRAGHFGQRGEVSVVAGKTATVAPQFEGDDYGGKKTYAYAAIVGGGALVLAAIALDALGKYDDFGGDVTRWSLLGVGAAGFVGGTILLKHTLDEAAPVKDVRYDVKIARLQGGAVATLGLRF